MKAAQVDKSLCSCKRKVDMMMQRIFFFSSGVSRGGRNSTPDLEISVKTKRLKVLNIIALWL